MISFRSLVPAIASAMIISTQVLPTAATAQDTAFRTIMLRDPDAISEAMSLNAAIDRIMGVVAACHAQTAQTALRCGCGATKELDRLKIVYRQVAARHPDWDRPNLIVSYRNPANGHWISLNFQAVDRILAECGRG
jgi:hypothetical protein